MVMVMVMVMELVMKMTKEYKRRLFRGIYFCSKKNGISRTQFNC